MPGSLATTSKVLIRRSMKGWLPTSRKTLWILSWSKLAISLEISNLEKALIKAFVHPLPAHLVHHLFIHPATVPCLLLRNQPLGRSILANLLMWNISIWGIIMGIFGVDGSYGRGLSREAWMIHIDPSTPKTPIIIPQILEFRISKFASILLPSGWFRRSKWGTIAGWTNRWHARWVGSRWAKALITALSKFDISGNIASLLHESIQGVFLLEVGNQPFTDCPIKTAGSGEWPKHRVWVAAQASWIQ